MLGSTMIKICEGCGSNHQIISIYQNHSKDYIEAGSSTYKLNIKSPLKNLKDPNSLDLMIPKCFFEPFNQTRPAHKWKAAASTNPSKNPST